MKEEFKIRSYDGITFVTCGTILGVTGAAVFAPYVDFDHSPLWLTFAIGSMFTAVWLGITYILSRCEIIINTYEDHLTYRWTKHPIRTTNKEFDIKYQDILEFKYDRGPSRSQFYSLVIKLKSGDTINIRTDSTWTDDSKVTDSFAKLLKSRKVKATGNLASLIEIDG